MEPILITGGSPILLIADHASNHVPEDIDLGIAPALLDEHIAVDIGTEALTRALAARLGASAVLASVSRLVIDLNREADALGLIPVQSDGHEIPGNRELSKIEREARIRRFYEPYHDAVAGLIASGPELVVSIHSFTPRLTSRPTLKRPWPIGILYNADERAARHAIELLRAHDLLVGDNEPYSGRVLNSTMNRHAEAVGLPYINIEVRQDLLSTAAEIDDWAELLFKVVGETAERLRLEGAATLRNKVAKI